MHAENNSKYDRGAFTGGAVDPALAAAIVSGNISELERLLGVTKSVREKICLVKYDNIECTVSPLFLATKLGHFNLVPTLLSHGANPAQLELTGESAFSIALKMRAYQALSVMLEADVDFSSALFSRNSDQVQPLDIICSDVKLIKLLPQIAARCARIDHVDDTTKAIIEILIVEAIEDEELDTLRSAMKLGWDIDKSIYIDTDIIGPALYYACYCGNYNSVVCLVELKADVNCKAADGGLAIECCFSHSSPTYEKIAIFLVENGVPLDIILPQYGCTILHAACRRGFGYPCLVSTCIALGADPTIQCAEGTLVLCNLAQERNHEMITVLISAYKEKVGGMSDSFYNFIRKKQSANGHWPLLLAVSNQDHATISLLLSSSADPNTVCDDGRSCLHIAALAGDLVTCKLLVGAGADLSLRSLDPLPTALDFAINQNHVEVATFLVLSGADLESRISSDPYSPSSIELAPEFMRQKIMEALQAFETFSSLRKIRMINQMNSFDDSASAPRGDSGAATPDDKSSKSMSDSKSNPSSRPASSMYFFSADSKRTLMAGDETSGSLDNIYDPDRGTPRTDFAELSTPQLKMWSERWGDEEALTHADVINFLTASASTSDLKPDDKASAARLLCLLCRSNTTNCMLKHVGKLGTSHICVCLDCGLKLQECGGNCPLCGEPVGNVLGTPVLKDTVHGKFFVHKEIMPTMSSGGETPRKKRSRSQQSLNADEILTGRHSIGERPGTAEMLGAIVVITPRSPEPLTRPGTSSSLNRQDSTGSLFQFCVSDPAILPKVIALRRQNSENGVPKLDISDAIYNRAPGTKVFVPTLEINNVNSEPLSKRTSTNIIQAPVRNVNGELDSVQIRRVGAAKRPGSSGNQRPNSSPKSSSLVSAPWSSPQLDRPKSHTSLIGPPSQTSAKSFTKVKTYSNTEQSGTLAIPVSNDVGFRKSIPGTFDGDEDSVFGENGGDLEIIDISSPRPLENIGKPQEGEKKKKKSKKKRKTKEATDERSSNRLADMLGVSIDEVVKRPRSNSSDVIISGMDVPALNLHDSLMPIPASVGSNNERDIETTLAKAPTYDEMPHDNTSICGCCVKSFFGFFVLIFVLVFYSVYSVFNPVYRTFSVCFIVMVACNNSGGADDGALVAREESNNCSIGGFICSIFTFIFGGIVYLLAGIAYALTISPLAVLSILQPQNFGDKYDNYKFIDLKNPLKPADKDEFANFDEIDLDRQINVDLNDDEYYYEDENDDLV